MEDKSTYQDYGLLGWDALWFGRWGKPTFWKSQMPPSSGEKSHSPSGNCHYCHENLKTSQLKIRAQNRLESNPWTINTKLSYFLKHGTL